MPASRPPSDEQGQGTLEYAMVIVLVAIIILVVLVILGPSTGNMYSNVVSNI